MLIINTPVVYICVHILYKQSNFRVYSVHNYVKPLKNNIFTLLFCLLKFAAKIKILILIQDRSQKMVYQ